LICRHFFADFISRISTYFLAFTPGADAFFFDSFITASPEFSPRHAISRLSAAARHGFADAAFYFTPFSLILSYCRHY
jgi:hypothetical protein